MAKPTGSNQGNSLPGGKLAKEFDLSHAEANLPPASARCVARHCLASLLLYGVVLLVLLFDPWFRDLLQVRAGTLPAWRLYLWAYAAYAVLAPAIYLVIRPRSLWNSKNVMILGWLRRVLAHLARHGFIAGNEAWRPSYKEKCAFFFLLIKMVYGPLMLNGLLSDLPAYAPLWARLSESPTWISRLDAAYSLFVLGVFGLDCALFCFGYHTEAGLLRNEVRYVETSLSGLIVCLICYPPFNMMTAAFLGSSNEDVQVLYREGLHHPLTWILRGLAVLALLLLTSASLSLFTKASNLTNRGIVRHGPYRWVRHPGYVGKNLFWLITLVPAFLAFDSSNPDFPWRDHLLFCATRMMGFLGWCAIYVLRALTEERLLRRDPDYVAYCRQVKYRFIPGVI